jgi:ferric-dicitrate binding protein FerR (iron transport regulator)
MIDPKLPYNELPWELIVPALDDELSAGEMVEFQQWLALSNENRSIYERLQQMWKEGMTDYPFYQQANEGKAWENLQQLMGESALSEGMSTLPEVELESRLAAIDGRVNQSRGRIMMMKWAAVAAMVLLMAGGEWLYVSRKGQQYATAANETKQVPLPDGSMVVLNEHTQLRVESGYNKADRKLVLVSGTARFDVAHAPGRPFVVEMGDVSVKDIGTSFTIDKMTDSIKVRVWEGKVAMVRSDNGETHEISAGQEESFVVEGRKFGAVSTQAYRMKFDDQPLSAVVSALENASGRTIVLNDAILGGKKLTIHLNGESFEDAIKAICATVNLEYSVVDGKYIIKDASGH